MENRITAVANTGFASVGVVASYYSFVLRNPPVRKAAEPKEERRGRIMFSIHNS